MNSFKVASIFSDHMVLQREKNIAVFGTGMDDKEVIIKFRGKQYITKIHNGSWRVMIPPQHAGINESMEISCDDTVHRYNNIAVGEVFLAGGQSNMEMELRNCIDGPRMLEEDKDVNVRYYYTMKNAHMDEEFYRMEEETSWCEFSKQNAANWSAVAYIYAKRLAKELEVVVGIIGCNWGGTSASCWMSSNALEEDKELATYLTTYEEEIRGKSMEQQKKEYEDYLIYHSEWEKNYGKLEKERPGISWEEAASIVGVCQWPGPMGYTNPYRPCGLYETMIRRIAPYTLKGVLYYQGESDDHKPEIYQKLLTRLIRQWRDDFEDMELPFLFVQLPMHRYKNDEDIKHWCILRDQQLNTYKTVKNTGIAIGIDCGEFNDIHPKDKRKIGERLALQALYHIYGLVSEMEAFGPMMESYYKIEEKVYINCRYAKEGMMTDGGPLIEISEDGTSFTSANVEFNGNTIIVWKEEVKSIVEVRYCWTNYGPVTIFGKNGLPLAPFRIFL